jgi:hypothetical protein
LGLGIARYEFQACFSYFLRINNTPTKAIAARTKTTPTVMYKGSSVAGGEESVDEGSAESVDEGIGESVCAGAGELVGVGVGGGG